MTTIDVTPAVQAAAEALLGQMAVVCGYDAAEHTVDREHAEHLAPLAVTAALPRLAEQFAQLVEAFADSDGTWIGPTDPDAIMRRTARLIREAATGEAS